MHRNRRFLNSQAHTHTHIVSNVSWYANTAWDLREKTRYKNKQLPESLYYYSNNTKARSDKIGDSFMVLIMIRYES